MPISKKIHRDKFNESQSTFLPLVQLIQEVSRSLQEAQNVQLNNISCQLVQRLDIELVAVFALIGFGGEQAVRNEVLLVFA